VKADSDNKLTSNLQITSLVDEQVLRLEVTMQDTVGVAVVETFDELVGEFLAVSYTPCECLL
jgi:hypothetical protein